MPSGGSADVILGITGNNDYEDPYMPDYLKEAIANAPSDVGAPSTGGYLPVGGSVPGSITDWLKKNSSAVYLGAGVLVLMAMFGRKGR